MMFVLEVLIISLSQLTNKIVSAQYSILF